MPVHFDGEIRINKINMGPYDNNGYILVCPETNEGVIIDTPAEPEKLLNEIGDVKVGHILITHNHQDHLLGFGEITGSVAVKNLGDYGFVITTYPTDTIKEGESIWVK